MAVLTEVVKREDRLVISSMRFNKSTNAMLETVERVRSTLYPPCQYIFKDYGKEISLLRFYVGSYS